MSRCSPAGRQPFLLLLLLHLSVTCSTSIKEGTITQAIAEDLAAHLHTDTGQLTDNSLRTRTWDSVFSIKRSLEGTGFHRTLKLELNYDAEDVTLEGCQLSLLQPLPSSVFADPYQLEELTRSSAGGAAEPVSGGYSYTFKLLGPLDLELPAPACQDTALLLSLNTSWHHHQQQQQQQASALTLLVPLHAKYPEPYAAGHQGWRWTMTGHVAARLPWPLVLADCRQQQGSVALLPPPAALQGQHGVCSSGNEVQSSSGACSSDSTSSSSSSGSGGSVNEAGDLVWMVPAGNRDHEVLVSWGTLLATAVCCLAVSWAAIRSSTFRC